MKIDLRTNPHFRRSGTFVALFQKYRQGAQYLFAAETSLLAGPYIFLSGQEVLPIGGVTGSSPFPTVHQLAADVASGKLRLVITPNISDPRIVWVESHCDDLVPATAAIGIYSCTP
ncbi:MAG: hypothetical protein ACRDWV_00660 [Acidimicrobiales bacterium]